MSEVLRALQEPWPDLRRQREGVQFGIWCFLASEVLFFSGLFVTYAVYRSQYPEAFQAAAAQTNFFYGTLNTVLLLTSSLAMTIALRAASAQWRCLTLGALLLTAALGVAFVVCKGLEYHEDLTRSLFPGAAFPMASPPTQLFWMLYWIITGIHAIHLTAGIGVVAAVIVLFWRRVIPVQGSTMEGVATYWHFVDCVWIIVYPLVYLIGRS